MHQYTTAELRKYADDVERSVTESVNNDDPDARALKLDLNNPLQKVLLGLYAWIIGEFANVREQLDRIEARLDDPRIILAPENFTPSQIAELQQRWDKFMEYDTRLPQLVWVPGSAITYKETNTHGN